MWTKLLWFSSESFYTSQCKRIEDTSVENLLIICFIFILISLFYFLFIGFNTTEINYQFVALLHWNSHIIIGIQKIILRQYFFTFLSIIFHIINFTLFAIFCHFGSFVFIDILTFCLLIFYKLSSYTSNIPIIVPCLSC